MRRALRLSPLVFAALSGCAQALPPIVSAGAPEPARGARDVSSGSPLERFFPLVDGNLYTYTTSRDEGGPGLLLVRVFRADAQRGEFRLPGGTRRFEYTPEGIRTSGRSGEGWVLKVPLEVGTTWRGEHGGTARITSVGAEVDTGAGHFGGCLQVVEERLGDRPIRFTTIFCPGVGVVQLEGSSGAALERASLKSYGPPVQMKPDGLDKTVVPIPP